MQWVLTAEEKAEFILRLAPHLSNLRAKIGISQTDLCHLIGISRQLYSAVETGKRDMSWETYLALLFFFDNNEIGHTYLRQKNIFPHELMDRFGKNGQTPPPDVNAMLLPAKSEILSALDEQARYTLRNLLLIEYARCTGMSGKDVVSAYDGNEFLVARKKSTSYYYKIKGDPK